MESWWTSGGAVHNSVLLLLLERATDFKLELAEGLVFGREQAQARARARDPSTWPPLGSLAVLSGFVCSILASPPLG